MANLSHRLDEAGAALATLEEVLREPAPTMRDRDAALMRFVYTFEAVWKAVLAWLREGEGIEVPSPKGCIRKCRMMGLLSDEEAEAALRMSDDRNLAVHTYHQELAIALFARLPGHARLLSIWLTGVIERVPSAPP